MPRHALLLAVKSLGRCAKKAAAARALPRGLSVSAAEIQVGIGTCGDNLAWASRLRRLDFDTSVKRGSARAASHLEATRFLYAWTAANALFSRDSVLKLLVSGKLPTSELLRFRLIYDSAGFSSAEVIRLLGPLHGFLEAPRSPKGFIWSKRATLRVLDTIYWKYTPDTYKATGRTAKKIATIVETPLTVTSLDIPEIVYSARNWLIHGALIDSSFRGNPGEFQTFISTATEATALVLERAGHRIADAL